MIYLKKYKLFENSTPYEFEILSSVDEPWKSDDSIFYKFIDGVNTFRVEFDRMPQNEAEVSYRVLNKDLKWTFEMVESNIFRIMETIFGRIIPDFIKKNDWCNSITIKGLGKGHEKEQITQRTKVYWRYLQKNTIDGWNIDRYGNEIYLDKND
jgi:hypothetical protein